MAQSEEDLQKIERIVEFMKKNDLTEVEIQHGDEKILLKRSGPLQPAIAAVGPAHAAAAAPINVPAPSHAEQTPANQLPDDLIEIKSPMVGTFYATPSPDSEPYVEIGSPVTEQTVVCIVEAMKVMNEIKAEVEGTIEEILVTSGQAVEYGHPLFRVKPD